LLRQYLKYHLNQTNQPHPLSHYFLTIHQILMSHYFQMTLLHQMCQTIHQHLKYLMLRLFRLCLMIQSYLYYLKTLKIRPIRLSHWTH
jgi:hypothetical protein